MATTTTNLGLTKPALSESADVGVINDNSDKIDVEAGKSRANFAATYSASSAYAVGDYCERGGNLYRCTTAIPSGGEAWNSGHWTQVAVTGEIPKVIDNLTSTSASAALSANQGKVLKDTVDGYRTSGQKASITMSTKNSWVNSNDLGFTVDNDTTYLITVLVDNYASSWQVILTGSSIKSSTDRSTPIRLTPSVSNTLADSVLIAFNSAGSKIDYYCGGNVYSGKTLKIKIQQML